MADVKIIDIDNVQWDIKDQVARNKLVEVDTVLKTQKANIEQLTKLEYINKRAAIPNIDSIPFWVRINNLYTRDYFENNIFIFTSRNGEYHQVMCGITDHLTPIAPIWIKFIEGTNKISAMCYKDDVIWVQLIGYSVLRVQQIAGNPVEITLTKETPPADAININMKQIVVS